MQNLVQHYGYAALFFLAVLESMCIPIPSEATFGFGGAMCTTHRWRWHPLNIVVVIIVGVVGSLIGSIIAYEVGRHGRALDCRPLGKWILLTHQGPRSSRSVVRQVRRGVGPRRTHHTRRAHGHFTAGRPGRNEPGSLHAADHARLCRMGVAPRRTRLCGPARNWEHVAKGFPTVIQWPVLGALIIAGGWFLWRRWPGPFRGGAGKHAKQ
jgi:hypothetical protein